MESTVPIFTYLHGESNGKITARILSTDWVSRCITLAFQHGEYEYRAYVQPHALPDADSKLVLFDGHLSPQMLWDGDLLLGFEYGKKDASTMEFAEQEFLVTENAATVKRKRGTLTDFPASYFEREELTDTKQTRARIVRQLLWMPRGHKIQGFRVKPRSLERQYTIIEAMKTNVIFRTMR